LEEIKVRWKKAALENCTEVPCVTAPSFTCGTISDIDGNSYNTVLIGTQCWTKENLKVTKYNDGSNIPEINSAGTWNNTIVTGARTVYGDLPVNLTTYGYLYNWYAATDSRKICPVGWHVPTDGEWKTLIQSTVPTETLGTSSIQSTTAGGKLKSTATNSISGTGLGWDPGSPGTDNFGFSALPGGIRSNVGSFGVIRQSAFFLSATEDGINNTWSYVLFNGNGVVARGTGSKSAGASVRCLRD
jgi:uncharacterized protein (TIGR02145 family)